MRIPIDDNTIGYISSHPYLQGILRYQFNKALGYKYEQDYEHVTFGEFKAKYNTTHTSTIESDPKWIDNSELKELAKTFVFKIPNN